MATIHCTYEDYERQLPFSRAQWSAVAEPPVELVVVDFSEVVNPKAVRPLANPPSCPVLGINVQTLDGSPLDHAPIVPNVDLVAKDTEDMQLLCASITKSPRAASVLVGLLRQTLEISVDQALFAESLAYSTLQHGEEFERFLANHKPSLSARNSESEARLTVPNDPAVLVERNGRELALQLNRPDRRNAYSAEMRDALCEALQLAQLDNSITRILLRGRGPAFSAGGDLSEFGLARDAAVAHLSRGTLSAGALLHELAGKVMVQVHGGCVGAGIELPAFAKQVNAAEDAFFLLPEVSMGLVPGAGGTVSLPRRIGCQRTAWLALSGKPIEAQTALQWGLIDSLS